MDRQRRGEFVGIFFESWVEIAVVAVVNRHAGEDAVLYGGRTGKRTSRTNPGLGHRPGEARPGQYRKTL